MPRRIRLRKVVAPPAFRGYRPYGINGKPSGVIELNYEEYEALKLTDYDGLKHGEACRLMGISRPTFARIYESARKKIARALVETREIKTVYGNAWMHGKWYICDDCHARFTLPGERNKHHCPLCASTGVSILR